MRSLQRFGIGGVPVLVFEQVNLGALRCVPVVIKVQTTSHHPRSVTHGRDDNNPPRECCKDQDEEEHHDCHDGSDDNSSNTSRDGRNRRENASDCTNLHHGLSNSAVASSLVLSLGLPSHSASAASNPNSSTTLRGLYHGQQKAALIRLLCQDFFLSSYNSHQSHFVNEFENFDEDEDEGEIDNNESYTGPPDEDVNDFAVDVPSSDLEPGAEEFPVPEDEDEIVREMAKISNDTSEHTNAKQTSSSSSTTSSLTAASFSHATRLPPPKWTHPTC